MSNLVYLDWEAASALIEGRDPELRGRLDLLREEGDAEVPFSPAHVMDAALASELAELEASQRELGRWLGGLSLLTGDRYWAVDAERPRSKSPFEVHATEFRSSARDRQRRELVGALFEMILPRLEDALRDLGRLHGIEVEDLVAELLRVEEPAKRVERFLSLLQTALERAGVHDLGDARLGELGLHLAGMVPADRAVARGTADHAALAVGALTAALGDGDGRVGSRLVAADLHLRFGLRADVFGVGDPALEQRALDTKDRHCRVVPLSRLASALPR